MVATTSYATMRHGQDRKVCWVRSRLDRGDLKFSRSTAWSRDLLNRIVHIFNMGQLNLDGGTPL